MLTFRSDDERRHCKKYSLRLDSFEAIIDIPPELDSTETFQPTLGPKVIKLTDMQGLKIQRVLFYFPKHYPPFFVSLWKWVMFTGQKGPNLLKLF